MEKTGRGRNPLLLVLGVLGAIVVLGGLGLGFFGIGAELAQPRTLRVTVRAKNLEKVIAQQVKAGDPIFTDTAGIEIGRIVSAVATPQPQPVPDSKGKLHLDPDPVNWQVDATVEAHGRVGNGLVVLDTQVVQSGQTLNLISKKYYLSGVVVSIDVR